MSPSHGFVHVQTGFSVQISSLPRRFSFPVCQWRAVPLVVWLLLQCSAWSLGHTSAVGRTLGLYCVYEDRSYEEHEQVASAAQVASGGERSARGGSECAAH